MPHDKGIQRVGEKGLLFVGTLLEVLANLVRMDGTKDGRRDAETIADALNCAIKDPLSGDNDLVEVRNRTGARATRGENAAIPRIVAAAGGGGSPSPAAALGNAGTGGDDPFRGDWPHW